MERLRLVRSVALLVVGILTGSLLVTPAIAHVAGPLKHLFSHTDLRYYLRSEANNRFLAKAAKAADADRLDGRDAASFASQHHTHPAGDITGTLDADRLNGLAPVDVRTIAGSAQNSTNASLTSDAWHTAAEVVLTLPDQVSGGGWNVQAQASVNMFTSSTAPANNGASCLFTFTRGIFTTWGEASDVSITGANMEFTMPLVMGITSAAKSSGPGVGNTMVVRVLCDESGGSNVAFDAASLTVQAVPK